MVKHDWADPGDRSPCILGALSYLRPILGPFRREGGWIRFPDSDASTSLKNIYIFTFMHIYIYVCMYVM